MPCRRRWPIWASDLPVSFGFPGVGRHIRASISINGPAVDPQRVAMGGHYRSTSGSHRAGLRSASTCSGPAVLLVVDALASAASASLSRLARPRPGIPLAAAATRPRPHANRLGGGL